MTTGSAVILYRECAGPTSQGVNAQTDDYPCQMGFKQSLYQQCDPTFCDNLEGRGAKSIKALNHKDTKTQRHKEGLFYRAKLWDVQKKHCVFVVLFFFDQSLNEYDYTNKLP